jgi:hypothetical protein
MKFALPLFTAGFVVLSSLSYAEDPSPSPSASAGDSAKPDFGDYKSSTLATKAWHALESNDLASVKAYTQKCIDTFGPQALTMQAALSEPPDTKDKEKVFANWALNDVGTCYFILGSALEKNGDKKGALEAYKYLAEKLPFAECWDTKGWFWKPADAAKGKLKALEFDAAS